MITHKYRQLNQLFYRLEKYHQPYSLGVNLECILRHRFCIDSTTYHMYPRDRTGILNMERSIHGYENEGYKFGYFYRVILIPLV